LEYGRRRRHRDINRLLDTSAKLDSKQEVK